MKNIRFEVRLTEYELHQLEEEATRRGMTKSAAQSQFNSKIARTFTKKTFVRLKSHAVTPVF
ncbi:hypothetical protein MiSe_87830 [Microseira wollei NIES-4236]|uniref:Ribbon-helix-helix protein CopG domain-containing protein n=1 Tax=Microseira wollei NIES-4236 TaxID=2530354 RepID=A0AAV3XT41_9CYAN|nr:hypothetical protein MiSe_87830 [Microseira wollei NIES-4236]